MQHTTGLGSEDINTFSICLRFNIKFLRPQLTTILSYSTFITDNSLLIYLQLLESNSKLSLNFCKYFGLSGITTVCNLIMMPSIRIHEKWHHICWLFNTENLNSNQIKVSTKLFLDGKQVYQGIVPRVNSYLNCKKE